MCPWPHDSQGGSRCDHTQGLSDCEEKISHLCAVVVLLNNHRQNMLLCHIIGTVLSRLSLVACMLWLVSGALGFYKHLNLCMVAC